MQKGWNRHLHWLLSELPSTPANVDLAPVERPETPPPPSSGVPFRRDNDFVDRGNLLGLIDEQCTESASRVALVGIGGVRYEFSSVEIVVVKLRRSRAFGHLTYSF